MDISGHDSLSSKSEHRPSGPPNYSEQQPSFPNNEGMDSPYTPLLFTPSRREPTSSRCSTTFLSILLILFVLNCLVTAQAILSTYQTQFDADPPLTALTDDDQSLKCINWGHTPNNAYPSPPLPDLEPPSVSWEKQSVEIDLPIDSESLFVFSRGSISSGIVQVHQSPKVKDVKVSVTAHYHKKKVLSSARVCLVQPKNGGDGVGIFTPFRWIPPRRKNSLFFVVDVTFPSSEHHPRQIPSFAVDVPQFGVDVADLSGYTFSLFALKSTNRPVTVTSVKGNSIIVEGKNGKIEGSFDVARFLKVYAANSPINVSLDVHNNPPSKPTVVLLKTSNSPLDSDLSLSTNSSSGAGGDFRVYTHTSNAPLDVSISVSPADSHLVFEGSTKNAPARVALPAAFEGGFLLRTTHFYPTLHVLPDVKDPAGRGRVRRVDERVIAGRAVIGNVSWVAPGDHPRVDADARAGWASIVTHNAPVMLVL